MTIVECLRKVVLNKWQRVPEDDETACLEEPGVMQVGVSGLTGNSLVLRIGMVVLSGVKDGPWKKSCDYAIVNQDGDTVRILFVELKKTLAEELKGLEQLRWSLPRMDHLRSLCHVGGGGSYQTEVRYALIASRESPRLDKQPVKRRRFPRTKQHRGIEVSLHVVAKQENFSRLWGD